MTSKARLFCGVTLMGLTLAACGGATTSSDSSPSPSAVPTTVSAPPGGTAAPAAEKVSANTASENEIAAALKAAGVSNAERWAHEVVEYRPYPADDPNLAKLRENLAKYNPGQETTDKIVSALTP
ncbi:MAG: hypothetical protein QOJ20_256 [Mycobacterium sp.]|jgi:ABC-type glycerol-3-phosphate transport system substrate-binding protein|nr:hypothetical protein [Mycobacterium sp.]